MPCTSNSVTNLPSLLVVWDGRYVSDYSVAGNDGESIAHGSRLDQCIRVPDSASQDFDEDLARGWMLELDLFDNERSVILLKYYGSVSVGKIHVGECRLSSYSYVRDSILKFEIVKEVVA